MNFSELLQSSSTYDGIHQSSTIMFRVNECHVRYSDVHGSTRVLPTPFVSTGLNSNPHSTRALAVGTYDYDVAESVHNFCVKETHGNMMHGCRKNAAQ